MYKRILLHGATNCESSNYGDFLYGEMIFEQLSNEGLEVGFYQPSDFFKKNIENYRDKVVKKKNADLIIYIPGGYFGEGHKAKLKENIIQFLRFMPLGIWASYKKIPMVVLGIGAGPINSFIMKFGIKRICNSSKVVTTRDHISYRTLKSLCPKANIIECGDMILSQKLKENKTNQIETILNIKKKKILVHYNHEKYALERFAECLNDFICNNDYLVVVTSDSILSNDKEYYEIFKEKFKYDSVHFIYSDPHELTSLIKGMDIVLTCKLHVGVVASLYQKSVIVAACHPEKTKRFYDQIEEANRCISLYEFENNQLINLLEKYKSSPIKIDSKIINKSSASWKILKENMEEKNEAR